MSALQAIIETNESSVFLDFYYKAKYSFFTETVGTNNIMGFAPGRSRFQLNRPIIGMVGVDATPGKTPKNP